MLSCSSKSTGPCWQALARSESGIMSLKKKTVRNLQFVGAAQLLNLCLVQVGYLILAKILTPDDFGIYAAVLVVFNLCVTISMVGLDQAAIQSKDESEELLRTAATFRMTMAIIAIVVVFILAPVIASFFGRTEMTAPLRVMTAALLISSAGFVSTVRLAKALRFRELSISKTGNAITWIAMALTGGVIGLTYWSMILATLFASAAALVILWAYAPWKVSYHIDKVILTRLLHFGKFPAATSIIVLLVFNLDKVVVGRWLGPELLGAYFLAFTWGTIVPNIFTNIVNTVMFPTYTHIVHDDSLLSHAYRHTLTYLGYVSLPISVGLASISSVFVMGVLGPQWHNATLPLAIFSFVGLCGSLTSPAGNVFLAKGRPDRMWLLTWVGFVPFAVLLVPAVVYGGLGGVSLLMLAIDAFMLIWVWFVASSLASTSFGDIARSLWVPTLCASVMGLVVYLVSTALTATIINLVALIALGVLIYVGLVLILADSDTKKEMLNLATLAIKR